MRPPVRILLVEDNPADVDLVQELLQDGRVEVEVAVARDGIQASELLAAGSPDGGLPDLVLLDLNLPKRNGHEVLAEIRSNEDLRHLPVVVLTSSDDDADIASSYQLGASSYVTKPVGFAVYQRTVESISAFWLELARLPPRSRRHRTDD